MEYKELLDNVEKFIRKGNIFLKKLIESKLEQ
jgi:hypothetical protein